MTWSTVSKDCSEIELPGEIVKNDDPLALPLAGPLEEIGNLLKKMRKTFPKPNDPVFNFKNFRWTWDRRAANSDSEHSTRRQKSTAALCLTISAEARLAISSKPESIVAWR